MVRAHLLQGVDEHAGRNAQPYRRAGGTGDAPAAPRRAVLRARVRRQVAQVRVPLHRLRP